MDYLSITTITQSLLFALFSDPPTPPEGQQFVELQIRNGGDFPVHNSGVFVDEINYEAPRPEDLEYYLPGPNPTKQFQFHVYENATGITSCVIITNESILTMALICAAI